MVEVGRVSAVLEADGSKLKSDLRKAHNDVQGWATNASKAGQISLGAVAGVAMAGSMMAINALMQAADKIGPAAAMSWEKGMGSAIKTIGIDKFDPGTGQLSAAYKTLNADLLNLRANLRGASQESIYSTASSLGSLGIAQDQIKGSTQVVLQNAAAFGMSSEDTSTKLAQVNTLWKEQSDLMGGATELFKSTGSAVNELGNKYSATESNVLSFLSEAGGTAGVWDRSIADTAAFGAMLETMGMKGPEAATGLRSALNEGLFAAGIETSKVPKGYKLAAQMLGIGDNEVKSRLNKDLYGTLIDIASAVDKKFGADSSSKSQAFKNIFGGYGVELGTKLAGKGDLFNEMLDTANAGFEEGTSAQKEYERQTDNLSGALDELKGAFDVLSITAWSGSLGPAQGIVEDVAEAVRGLTTALATGDWSQFTAAIDTMKQKLVDFVYGIDYSGIGNDILTSVVDSLDNTDYNAIGQTLLSILKGAWNLAVEGFGGGEDSRLSEILSKSFIAFKGVIGPTIDHVHDVFVTKMAGVVGAATVAGVRLGDGIVGGLQAAYVTISNIFADIYAKITGLPVAHIRVEQSNGGSSSSSSSKSSSSSITGYSSGGGGGSYNAANTADSGFGIPNTEKYKPNKVESEAIDSRLKAGAPTSVAQMAANLAKPSSPKIDIGGTGVSGWTTVENLWGDFVDASKTELAYINTGINDLQTWDAKTFGENGKAIPANMERQGQSKAEALLGVPSLGVDENTVPQLLGVAKIVVKPTADTITDAINKGLEWKPHSEEELDAIRLSAEKDAIALMGGLHEKTVSEGDTSKEKEVETPLPVVDTAVKDALQTKATEQSRLAAEAAALDAAAREAAITLLNGSQEAANAIRIGGEVSANFSTQGGQAVRIGLTESGREIATIGQVAQRQWEAGGNALYSKVVTGGSSAGSSMASGGQAAASALIGVAGSFSNSLRYSNVPGGILDTGNIFGKLSGSANTSSNAMGFDVESDLNNFGSVPKGWTSAVEDADKTTKTATESTDSLCASVSDLDTYAQSASSSVGGMVGELSNEFYPLSGNMQRVEGSAYDASKALSLTAEGMDTWCEAASDFAAWQETTSGLFQQSYIGPTANYPGNQASGGGSYGGWTPTIQGTNTPYALPPVFMASEAYVSSPTLAVVGDRPGGEYVVGAARFEDAVNKIESSGASRGGNSVTVTVIVQGDVTGDGLVERITKQVEDNIAYFFTKED